MALGVSQVLLCKLCTGMIACETIVIMNSPMVKITNLGNLWIPKAVEQRSIHHEGVFLERSLYLQGR